MIGNDEFWLPAFTGEDVGRAAIRLWRKSPHREGSAPTTFLLEAEDAINTELMKAFCSLGYNCELGVAQRAFGAEPLDLFRWSSLPLDALLPLLRNEFAGIGDADKLQPKVVGNGQDYIIRHKAYGFAWHAWAKSEEFPSEKIIARDSARMPWLARKLVEDLATGDRIFVRLLQPGECADELLPALARYGAPKVLLVSAGDRISVTQETDTLARATLDKVGDPAQLPSTVSSQSWLSICQAAAEMFGMRPMSPQ